MNLAKLSRLGLKHLKNSLAEQKYLKHGYDATQPVTFYGLVNERCNNKCKYCEYWRLDKYSEEMALDEWKCALQSVKDFVGEYYISFSGGEPLMFKGFLDLLLWCHEQGIQAGVTTNGVMLREATVRKLVETHPANVNISCDAPLAEIHDDVRGMPGSFEKISNGIGLLLQESRSQKKRFPIIIKTVIHAANFRLLPDQVVWAQRMGATAINFQPLDEWTPETTNELWIGSEHLAELQGVVNKLLEMKTQGAPIMNSETTLKLTVPHFRREKASQDTLPCRVGMRNFFIRPNGDIEVCFFHPIIGNIKKNSAKEIWYGATAQEIRKQTVHCNRLCLHTCLAQKSIFDKVKVGLRLLGW